MKSWLSSIRREVRDPMTHARSAPDLTAQETPNHGNLRGVHTHQWVSFQDFSQESLDKAVRQPFQERQLSMTFSVSLASGPMDRVIVRFLDNCVEYVAPAQFPNAELRDMFTNRWLSTRPLFAGVMECYPSLRGECQLWLDDEPSGPGLVFCGNTPGQVCIPDPSFLGSAGYMGSRIEFLRLMKPWESRSSKLFWRGGTSGLPRDPWQALPRIDLCFKVGEINQDDIFDVGISYISQFDDANAIQQITDSGVLKARCPQIAFMEYKYTIDIDGNTCSWGLFMKLLMQNAVIKVDSRKGWRQWYYDRLIPWRNFVPLSSSMTELYDIAQWLREHDDEAAQIAIEGRQLAQALTFDQVMSDVAPIIRDHVAATKHLPGVVAAWRAMLLRD